MDRFGFGVGDKNYFNMPYWVAVERGFLADENIETVPYVFLTAEENEERLETGVAPLVYHSAENQLARIEAGARARIIAGSMHHFPFTFIGAPDVTSVSQLRGRVVGVSSLEGGTSTILRRYLARHGLTYQRDYDMQPVGMIRRRWEMLQSGELGAGLQGIPLDLIALEQGFNDLGDYAEGIGEYQFSCMSANTEWAQDNRELVVRFLRAIIRAARWLYANREASIPIAAKYTELDPKYLGRAWDLYTGRNIFPKDGEISMPGMRALLDISSEVKSLEFRRDKSVDDYVDPSYYTEAFSSLNAGG